MRLTTSMVSGVTWLMLPCMSHSKPFWMPMTSMFSKHPRMVMALMTLLMLGAGPPTARDRKFLVVHGRLQATTGA